MDTLRAQSPATAQEQELLELMREVDDLAQSSHDRWTEKRAHERKRLRTLCELRFIGPDGDNVLAAQARTREISMGGMSFISREHFRRQTQMLVTLALSSASPRHLPGLIVYSRRVREGWFLTGMRFGRTQDARLQPEAYDQIQAIDAQSLHQGAGEATVDEKTTPRERMLRQLLSASVAARTTRELADKVVMASMCSDHVVRLASIPVLMKVGGQQAILSLMRLLNDDNPRIQAEAAEALGLMRASQSLHPLRTLLRHPDEGVAVRAAEALGRLGDRSGLRLVVRLLLMEGQVSRRAAKAFGAIVGREFHPNTEGVEQARGYLKTNGL